MVNAEEKKIIEQRQKEEEVIQLIMGKNYTCVIQLEDYEFYIHAPTIEEQLKIVIDSRNLRKGLEEDDVSVMFITDILATLNIVVDKIVKKVNGERIEINQKFWDYFKSCRDPKIYNKVIIPLNKKYQEFLDKINIDEAELKNA